MGAHDDEYAAAKRVGALAFSACDMIRLKARVRDGRLLVDEPTDLPEGAELELIAADSWDDLDDAERERLHATLAASEDDMREGRLRSASAVIADLRHPGS